MTDTPYAGAELGFVNTKLSGCVEPAAQLNVETLEAPAEGQIVTVKGAVHVGTAGGNTTAVTCSLAAAFAGAQTVRQFVPHAGHCATTLITLVAGAA
jgi:hypothetical protein